MSSDEAMITVGLGMVRKGFLEGVAQGRNQGGSKGKRRGREAGKRKADGLGVPPYSQHSLLRAGSRQPTQFSVH